MWEAGQGAKLPGFPIWADDFVHVDDLVIPSGTPAWKANFLRKNALLYTKFQDVLDSWLREWNGLDGMPQSRRKLEWQAQDAASIWEGVIHLRPSGIRVKKATYLPALVAITQTSIIGPRRRRLTPREAARLQGLPDWFDFGAQSDAATYKQLGNGVNVGAAYYVLREHVHRDAELIEPRIRHAVLQADTRPAIPSHHESRVRGSRRSGVGRRLDVVGVR
jgi:DNA (cytosine-5)-methyltransferase 1